MADADSYGNADSARDEDSALNNESMSLGSVTAADNVQEGWASRRGKGGRWESSITGSKGALGVSP